MPKTGQNKLNLRGKIGVFTFYLIVLFINAFVDIGHKTVIISTIYKLSGEGMFFNES